MAKAKAQAQADAEQTTEATATAPETEAAAPAGKTPTAIRLIRPHGFIDDKGAHRFWPIGIEVTDPAEVKLLVSRGAEHEVIS